MSLFDEFVAEQEKKAEEERQKKARELEEKAKKEKEKAGETTTAGQAGENCQAAAKPSAPKKPKDVEVPPGVIVRFAGETVMTTENTMKLEDIRKILVKEYPELTKELTHMQYIEKKSMVVIMPKGAKGGAGQVRRGYFSTVEDLKRSHAPINTLALPDGTKFEVRVNEIGLFSVIVKEGTAPEMAPFFEGFISKLPRIPFELLAQVIAWFRHTAQKSNMEALVHVFYAKNKGAYFLYVPYQNVTKLSYQTSEHEQGFIDLQLDEDNILVMDIHSHCYMPAKFSSIDDEYHTWPRLYAVIGRLDKPFPDISVRFCCGGRYRPLDYKQVFEMPFKDYPVIWDERLFHN